MREPQKAPIDSSAASSTWEDRGSTFTHTREKSHELPFNF